MPTRERLQSATGYSREEYDAMRGISLRPERDGLAAGQTLQAVLMDRVATADSFASQYRVRVEELGKPDEDSHDRSLKLSYAEEVDQREAPELGVLAITEFGPIFRSRKRHVGSGISVDRSEAGFFLPKKLPPEITAGLESRSGALKRTTSWLLQRLQRR